MEDLTICLVQSNLLWEDKRGNLDVLSDKIKRIDRPCDLIVLPEMFTTAFSMNTEKLAEDMSGEALTWMTSMAEEKNCVLTGSIIAKSDGKYFNRLIWMKSNGEFRYYDKRHLFRMAEEEMYFSAGSDILTTEIKHWKIRPQICYDLRFPVWSRNRMQKIGNEVSYDYDVILYVANWPSVRVQAWDILLRARAVENQVYCIGLNRVGRDGMDLEYNGHSAVVDPKGSYIVPPSSSEERIYFATLPWEPLQSFRKKFPQGLDADKFNLSN